LEDGKKCAKDRVDPVCAIQLFPIVRLLVAGETRQGSEGWMRADRYGKRETMVVADSWGLRRARVKCEHAIEGNLWDVRTFATTCRISPRPKKLRR
jgi:hypothetical protein